MTITILLLAAVLGIALVIILAHIDWGKETEDMRDVFRKQISGASPSIEETWDK